MHATTPTRRRPRSNDLASVIEGTEGQNVPSITISSDGEGGTTVGGTGNGQPASPFSSGVRPATSPQRDNPPSFPTSPFSPPAQRQTGGRRSGAVTPTSPSGGASPLSAPSSPASSAAVSPSRRSSLASTHLPYRTPAMGLEVLQVDLTTAKVNPTYTAHTDGGCTLNTTPEVHKHIAERPRAAELLRASKDLIKGFANSTLKLRFDFVHKDTHRDERFFGTGIVVAPNLVLTVRHFLFYPDASKRNDYTLREHIVARVDNTNGAIVGLRVCRTHPELYKDSPLWLGSNLNWTDINKMPSDIDPMSSFRERSAEHWVWRDFVFLRVTTPSDLHLPPPYFLPETDVFTQEPVMVGGYAIGETDNERLLSKYETYVRIFQQATENKVHLPFFSSRTEETWPEFVHTVFHRYPRRNLILSLGTVHENTSQRLGLYTASTEKGMAGSAVSPVYEAVDQQHSVTLPLWGLHAGRFTEGLYNVFLSVEHPLFIVQYAYTILDHFLSDDKYDVPETVEFKKRIWNYLSYFDWLDAYCNNLRVEVYEALKQSQSEELNSLPPPKSQTAVSMRAKQEDIPPTRSKRKRDTVNEPLIQKTVVEEDDVLPLEDMSVDKLKIELRRRGEKTSGTKSELIKRLEEARTRAGVVPRKAKLAKIVPLEVIPE